MQHRTEAAATAATIKWIDVGKLKSGAASNQTNRYGIQVIVFISLIPDTKSTAFGSHTKQFDFGGRVYQCVGQPVGQYTKIAATIVESIIPTV